MAFKILITDGSTPLARKLLDVYEDKGYDVVSPGMSLEQWGDVELIKNHLVNERPALVINNLLHGEFSESEVAQASRSLALASGELGLKVIHLSSHEVFAPEQSRVPLDEASEPAPSSEYGRSLKVAEDLFLENPSTLVVRLPWILDLPGGILDSVLEELRYQPTIQVCESWFGSLLSLSEVTRVLVGVSEQVLCNSNNWGVMHLHSSDRCSEVEFVDYLQRILDKEGVPSAQVNLVSYEFRLLRSGSQLTGSRCTNGFGVQFRSWRHGVKSMVVNWLKAQPQHSLQ